MEKELCIKFCEVLISFHEGMNLQSFESRNPRIFKTIYPWFSLHIFITLMENEPFTQFYGRFNHFLRTYVVKF